jgi:cobyrinic acid a,c-diamide synthase
MRLPRLLVAAPGSSSGKTTLSLLLTAWARRQGLDVRAFKAGPDFIDPQYLTALSGGATPSLDPWFLAPAALRRHFGAWAGGGDLALVEGVMGLYDGKRDAPFGRYSSAEVAQTLGLPVLIVLNARKAGPTLATQALGLVKAGPSLRFAGVVLNQCQGAKTAALIGPALRRLTGLPLLGWLPPIPALALPERHLGLTAPSELAAWQERLEGALPLAQRSLDLAGILKAARQAMPWDGPAVGVRAAPAPAFKLAVALDEAFHFYYPENLALLQGLGAELAFFSPLRDGALPAGSQGLLVGGGFPESFGAALAANRGLRAGVKAALARGLPVWAECGGLMWLGRRLRDQAGKMHAMVGALALDSAMTPQLQRFGYAQARGRRDGAWLGKGQRLKGHEFHHSVAQPLGPLAPGWDLLQSGRPDRPEGWRLPGGIATYFHAYLPSNPGAARAFARACHAWSPR